MLARFGLRVVAAVGDARLVAPAVAEHAPDLLITDVRIPPGNADDGLRAAVALREQNPEVPVLVLSQYVEQSYAARLVESGGGAAVGYLLKDRVGAITDFARAVLQVAEVARSSTRKVVRQLLRQRKDPLQRLSPREWDVLALMAEGRPTLPLPGALRDRRGGEQTCPEHFRKAGPAASRRGSPEGASRVLAVLAFLRSA